MCYRLYYPIELSQSKLVVEYIVAELLIVTCNNLLPWIVTYLQLVHNKLSCIISLVMLC